MEGGVAGLIDGCVGLAIEAMMEREFLPGAFSPFHRLLMQNRVAEGDGGYGGWAGF